jgi:hypothetical protein
MHYSVTPNLWDIEVKRGDELADRSSITDGPNTGRMKQI